MIVTITPQRGPAITLTTDAHGSALDRLIANQLAARAGGMRYQAYAIGFDHQARPLDMSVATDTGRNIDAHHLPGAAVSIARGLDANCRWCGHPPHPGACPADITTGTAKKPATRPCPCERHKKGPNHGIDQARRETA